MSDGHGAGMQNDVLKAVTQLLQQSQQGSAVRTPNSVRYIQHLSVPVPLAHILSNRVRPK